MTIQHTRVLTAIMVVAACATLGADRVRELLTPPLA